ncbi:MAG: hypothetical protein PWQ99_375 [Clostridia bacterium]|uniref:NADPH-dependent glutamate synthase large subunit GltB n=1 Tax=Thermacetogenium phaeum TaxID=85874 RepID=A0A101FGS4_9THEO|nr:MAG: NADPH-dependent glutamate synthase large subunit GltB [Thermacetogenium phaeum]MDK2880600.1 hypothetical protein [Clostridia bacterium]
MEVLIKANGKHYRELNAEVRSALARGASQVALDGVNGQYYIGAGLQGDRRLIINGTPGNDTGCYLDGPELVIHGNAQDVLGNTMNGGRIIVHGSAGDVLGYGMRGGEIFVRDNVGYRVGIHMKEYQDQCPVIVIGNNAGAFLGEYMAGGRIIVLGLRGEGRIVGSHCGSGMHGGCIYIRGRVEEKQLSPDVLSVPLDESDIKLLDSYFKRFCEYFGVDRSALLDSAFQKLVPRGNRPYAGLYTGL